MQQLKYFVSLADNGSFHAAAAACYVSQSTLSTGIKNLETQLGVLLVDRSNRVLVFTEVGQQILAIAREVLSKAHDIVIASRASHELLTGTIKIGGIPTILPFILSDLLSKARSSYPELNMEFTEDTSDKLIEKLLQGRLDLLILALPYSRVERENLQTLTLFEDKFHLAYPSSLEKEVGGKGEEPEQLPIDRLLLMGDGHCLRGHALDACSLKRQSRISTFEVTNLQTLKGLVAGGIGYTFFPDVALKDAHFINGDDIKTEPVLASRSISLVWRKSSSRDEEFKLFAELFEGYEQLVPVN